jgi:hypothetical protein
MRIQCVCTSPLNFHTDGFPQAFTKRERLTSNPQYSGAGASSGSGIQAPTKKTTEWYCTLSRGPTTACRVPRVTATRTNSGGAQPATAGSRTTNQPISAPPSTTRRRQPPRQIIIILVPHATRGKRAGHRYAYYHYPWSSQQLICISRPRCASQFVSLEPIMALVNNEGKKGYNHTACYRHAPGRLPTRRHRQGPEYITCSCWSQKRLCHEVIVRMQQGPIKEFLALQGPEAASLCRTHCLARARDYSIPAHEDP